jgi:hypothetical protein
MPDRWASVGRSETRRAVRFGDRCIEGGRTLYEVGDDSNAIFKVDEGNVNIIAQILIRIFLTIAA